MKKTTDKNDLVKSLKQVFTSRITLRQRQASSESRHVAKFQKFFNDAMRPEEESEKRSRAL